MGAASTFEIGRSLNGRSEILKMEDLKRGGGSIGDGASGSGRESD